MDEIDLVPSTYRRQRWTRRTVVRFASLYVVVLVVLAGAKIFVSSSIDAHAAQLARQQADETSALQRKVRLDALDAEHEALLAKVEVLERLRAGPPVRQVFLSIDAALDGRVWFTDWQFRRAGEFVEVEPDAVDAGYFLLVPDVGADKGARAWRLRTHMEIQAKALDHSVLAGFVDRLDRDRLIEEVKVLNTRGRHVDTREEVDFEIAVVVSASGGGA